MACIFFSISSGKLEIVKVLHKTRTRDKLVAIWLFRARTILRVPDRIATYAIGEEITRKIKLIAFFVPEIETFRDLRTTRWLRLLKLRTGELAMYWWILHVITTQSGTPGVVIPAVFSNGYSEYKIVLFFELHHWGTKYILTTNLEWIKH